jgi:hypothetical protein
MQHVYITLLFYTWEVYAHERCNSTCNKVDFTQIVYVLLRAKKVGHQRHCLDF